MKNYEPAFGLQLSFCVVAMFAFSMYGQGMIATACAQQEGQPYRLNAVDLKQPVIWQAECLGPEGRGLAFGGQDQDAEDGRAHTRLLDGDQWNTNGQVYVLRLEPSKAAVKPLD